MKHNRHMGRLKRNRTADRLLDAAATAGQPEPATDCRVDKPGQSQEAHTLPFAGSNPAPATTLESGEREAIAELAAANAEVEALVAAAGWHGPPRGRETVEEHHARWLREKAAAALPETLQREIYLAAAARLDGKEV